MKKHPGAVPQPQPSVTPPSGNPPLSGQPPSTLTMLGKEVLKSLLSAVLSFLAIALLSYLAYLKLDMDAQEHQLAAVRYEIENTIFMLRSICDRTPETEFGIDQGLVAFTDILSGKHATWKADQSVPLRALAAQVTAYTKSQKDADETDLLNSVTALQLDVYEVTGKGGTASPHDRIALLKKATEVFTAHYDKTRKDSYKFKVYSQFDYSRAEGK